MAYSGTFWLKERRCYSALKSSAILKARCGKTNDADVYTFRRRWWRESPRPHCSRDVRMILCNQCYNDVTRFSSIQYVVFIIDTNSHTHIFGAWHVWIHFKKNNAFAMIFCQFQIWCMSTPHGAERYGKERSIEYACVMSNVVDVAKQRTEENALRLFTPDNLIP